MINSLRRAYRSLKSQSPYTLINIFGLTVGLTAVLLILIWVRTELSFDRFHSDFDDIYRVNLTMVSPNRQMTGGNINAPAGPEYKAKFPVIEESVRTRKFSSSLKYKNSFTSAEVMYTDSAFFQILSFNLISGNKNTCLNAPDKIVLCESLAKSIFGSEVPVGKMIDLNGEFKRVSAIAKDPPVNSSIQFDVLAPISLLYSNNYIGWDGGLHCTTYLKLNAGTDPKVLEKDLLVHMDEAYNNRARQHGFESIPHLQEMKKMHLYSSFDYDFIETGSISRVITFSLTGLLILLVACLNFVNINTAISIKRTKEVGIKKIYGVERKDIILQFISESGLAIAVSLLFASLLTQYLLPYFSQLVATELNYSMLSLAEWIISFAVLYLICTFLASFYGAWYVSAIKPLTLIRDSFSGKRRELSRNILVTTQFVISSGLIICTLIFYSQMRYAGNIDVGFNKHNVVSLQLSGERSVKVDLLKESLKAIPGIVSVTKSAGGTPGFGLTSNGYQVGNSDEIVLANCIYADPDYIKTMGISIKEGRDFRDEESDRYSILINETMAKMQDWKESTGKTIVRNSREYEVIGVMKDFHTSSLHNSIQPLVMPLYNEWGSYGNILIRTSGVSFNRIADRIEELFLESDPGSPFTYTILEDSMKSLYSKERYINILFLALSIIGIVVSCLGLFGLTTFSAQIRRKEIGIRKVNGALIRDITSKFSRELLIWIAVAFIIAAPLSYIIMRSWLTGFAFRIEISVIHYLISALIVLFIGFASIGLALIRELSRNPADLLRNE